MGKGEIIPGMDKGLDGLCKGAKATLIIPPEEGYGKDGFGDKEDPEIPPNATLNFDVEVTDIQNEMPDIKTDMDKVDMFS